MKKVKAEIKTEMIDDLKIHFGINIEEKFKKMLEKEWNNTLRKKTIKNILEKIKKKYE